MYSDVESVRPLACSMPIARALSTRRERMMVLLDAPARSAIRAFDAVTPRPVRVSAKCACAFAQAMRVSTAMRFAASTARAVVSFGDLVAELTEPLGAAGPDGNARLLGRLNGQRPRGASLAALGVECFELFDAFLSLYGPFRPIQRQHQRRSTRCCSCCGRGATRRKHDFRFALFLYQGMSYPETYPSQVVPSVR